MNYFKSCDITTKLINDYSISDADLELFYNFLSQEHILNIYLNASPEEFNKNIPYIISCWFEFLQNQKTFSNISQNAVYGGTIYRATFGSEYTLEHLAKNPIYYSRGSNGAGLYAVADIPFGISYLKNHLSKRFSAFDDKVGNILKIDVNENSTIMSNGHIKLAKVRFIEEIRAMNIDERAKSLFIKFLNTDSSITALLLGADITFMPNGHVIVLNKKALILPTSIEKSKNQTLRINLEKFRARDSIEIQRINEFLQK